MTFAIAAAHKMLGNAVNHTKFQGVSTIAQLEAYGLARPTEVALATAREVKANPALHAIRDLRDSINRRFDKPRLARVDVYAEYIHRVEDGAIYGGTPAITLWCSEQCSHDSQDNSLLIPYNAMLFAIDGETQTEARFKLWQDQDHYANSPIAVTVYHGIPVEHAQQILHDYNRYATPVTESKLSSFNHTGAIPTLVKEVIEKTPVTSARINRGSPNPRKKDHASYAQLAAFGVGHIMGEEALSSTHSKWLDALSRAGSESLVDGAVDDCVNMLRMAMNNDKLRTASPMVWQVAGILSKNRGGATNVNLAAGLQFAESMATALNPQTNLKYSIKGKLEKLHALM